MKKSKKKAIIIIIVMCIILVYLFLYFHIGIRKLSEYRDEVLDKSFSLSASRNGYYVDLLSYDDLSLVYRMCISEEEFIDADTDEKRLEIYQKIKEVTLIEKNTAFHTTKGMRKGGYTEVLVVDDVKYLVGHEIDVKAGFITLEPYIAKWVISIERIYE